METCDFQAAAQPINMKFCSIDYVSEFTCVPKMIGIGWLAATPQIEEI
jgi:hypothetical protein